MFDQSVKLLTHKVLMRLPFGDVIYFNIRIVNILTIQDIDKSILNHREEVFSKALDFPMSS